jgi:hypothetical protein
LARIVGEEAGVRRPVRLDMHDVPAQLSARDLAMLGDAPKFTSDDGEHAVRPERGVVSSQQA